MFSSVCLITLYAVVFRDFTNPKFLCGNVFPFLQFFIHNGPTILQHIPHVAALNEGIFAPRT